MTINTQKLVRVLAPTGPSGGFEKVHILPSFTGPTGTFPNWTQLTAVQQAAGPTGTFKTVCDATGLTGPHGEIKTVIIPGYTGPA